MKLHFGRCLSAMVCMGLCNFLFAEPPPLRWKDTHLKLGELRTARPVQHSVVPDVLEANAGVTPTLRVVSGPSWLKFSGNHLSGTPGLGDVGAQSWEIEASSGNFLARARVSAEVVNARPQWTQDRIDFGKATEDSLWQADISNIARDEDSDSLRFRRVGGAEWIRVEPDGKLSGTPGRRDLGRQKVTLEVTDGVVGHEREIRAEVEVTRINKAPRWSQDAKPLRSATERQPYQRSISSLSEDPDDDAPLQYEKVAGPEWLTVAGDGTLHGTPARKDVGDHRLKVKVRDPSGATSETELKLQVQKDNRPPQWSVEELKLPPITEDSSFNYDVGSLATDPDGEPVQFIKKSGPSWLNIDPKGKLSGTPKLSDIGNFTVKIEATDGEDRATLRAEGMVVMRNYAPVLVEKRQLQFVVKEREVLELDLSDEYFFDRNWDPLTFSVVDSAVWLTLQTSGKLALRPQFNQIGAHTFTLRVSDGKITSTFPMTVTVSRNPRPPVWKQPKFELKTSAREPFEFSLKERATDSDALPLVFTKASGPEWLKVTPEGKLSGTPPDERVGKNSFEIRVANDLRYAETAIEIEVLFKNHPPVASAEALKLTLNERDQIHRELAEPPFVQDIDRRDVLVFNLLQALPSWIQLSKSGALTLAPKFENIGTHTFRFKITDGTDTIEATLNVTVNRSARLPRWTDDSLRIQHKAREPFTLDLTTRVTELDPVPLKFSVLKGPSFLQLTPEGALSGTPQDSHIGRHELIIRAQNDRIYADESGRFEVLFNRKAPVWSKSTIALNRVRAGDLVRQPIGEYAYAPDEPHTVTFKKISGPHWLVVKPDGELFGIASQRSLGENKVVVRATNIEGQFTDATVTITVSAGNSAPRLKSAVPELPKASPGRKFEFDLTKFFEDPEGDPITFRLVRGPDWMQLSSRGILSGIPKTNDAQVYTLSAEASDGRESIQFSTRGRIEILPF